ncbi:MAG: VWA domain-containing protein [Burkholderiales bacterium]
MIEMRMTATAFLASLLVVACARVPQEEQASAAAVEHAEPALAQSAADAAAPPPVSEGSNARTGTTVAREAAAGSAQADARSRIEARPAPSSPALRSLASPDAAQFVAKREMAKADAVASAVRDEDRERYQGLTDNPVHRVAETPVSTFSIDVDTGSYSNVRRMLAAGQLPPPDAVRVEELVNYFPYDYGSPDGAAPFAVHSELAPSPWHPGNLILRIGIQGQDRAKETLPPANLVFLVDVSGSMESADKLPLLKSSLKLLVDRLRPQDRITLVTYAGGTAVILPPTSGSEHARITAAIDALRAGGSTAGASGIELAYRAAQEAFIAGGINRILLATDGDFNVGVTDFRQLKAMVEEKRKSGVALTTLGFGTGNYNEQLMEQLADAGDGAYSYIDTLMEGHKVLANEMTSTLATIARDVKVQVEFNPATVREYRLIGYENRALQREDFNNDRVDAGDIGAGHTVTALYELTPADGKGWLDDKRYGPREAPSGNAHADELAHVKLRYKAPAAESSRLLDFAVARMSVKSLDGTSGEFRFALAVAGFGQVLRGGRYTGTWSYGDVRELARGGVGPDRFGYRGEFLRLVDVAQSLATRRGGDAVSIGAALQH